MASVALHSVRKSFGSNEVLHGIDLEIKDGEFVALVGPSGCGKSTLLRLIAGLETLSSGIIQIGERTVNTLNPGERDIAMVFQNYALYPHMTIAQNMTFNLKLAGISKAEMATRVAEVARMLDLTDLLERRPNQLSGGQRQRVAMGRAVIRNPAVFLFDEPLSNLDAKLRVQMRAEIKALHRKVKTTSIYVTHDQIEAMTLADRVVILNKGRIEQQGTPLELYRTPATLFAAGFIGSPAMNFLEANVQSGDGQSTPVAVLNDGTRLALPAQIKVHSGQNVILGIRPEHMLPDNSGLRLSGPTQLIEPTGANTHVLFTLAGQEVTALVDGTLAIQPDSLFSVSIRPDMIHVFDKESRRRLN